MQDILQRIKDELETYLFEKYCVEGDSEISEIIDKIKKVDTKEQNPWITDRLPEENGHYLVTYHEWSDGNWLPKYDDIYTKIQRFHNNEWKFGSCIPEEAEADKHREILAWKYLDRPYEMQMDKSKSDRLTQEEDFER